MKHFAFLLFLAIPIAAQGQPQECPAPGVIVEVFHYEPCKDTTQCQTRDVYRNGKWVEETIPGTCFTLAIACGRTERVCVKEHGSARGPGDSLPADAVPVPIFRPAQEPAADLRIGPAGDESVPIGIVQQPYPRTAQVVPAEIGVKFKNKPKKGQILAYDGDGFRWIDPPKSAK